MLSSKGFLAPGPDRRLRMTAKQKIAVLEALSAARDYMIDSGLNEIDRQGMVYAELMIVRTLRNYPTDRSCITCDFFDVNESCMHWKQYVPADAIEAGCDEHAGDGVPF